MEILSNWKRALAQLLFDPPWNSIPTMLRHQTEGAASLLDVGCGSNSPVGKLTNLRNSVGVDIHLPSINESKRRGLHSSYVCMDVTDLTFASKSFDIVIALDLIEHLDKLEAVQLLDRLEDIAKVRVIIFTPNGFVDTNTSEILERYGNNPWRIHRCGFTVRELLDRGYHCYGYNGLKWLRYGDASIRMRPAKLFLVISNLSQLLTYHIPSLAFQFVGIKEIAAERHNDQKNV